MYILYILYTYREKNNIILSNCNDQVLLYHHVALELQKFPFISKIHVGFKTQLMQTSKLIHTVSKRHSYGIQQFRDHANSWKPGLGEQVLNYYLRTHNFHNILLLTAVLWQTVSRQVSGMFQYNQRVSKCFWKTILTTSSFSPPPHIL